MYDDALFLDGESERPAPHQPKRPRTGAVVAALVGLLAVGAVAAGLVVAGGGSSSPSIGAAAKQHVLSALSATTDSGSFAVTYELSGTPSTTTPSTSSTTLATVACVLNGAPSLCGATPRANPQPIDVTGSGTIDTDPKASVVSADLGGGTEIVLRVDTTDIYEEQGSGDNGLTPPPEEADAPGQSMSGFAGATEQVLGPREGAVAMLGMASPNGYLNLAQAAITSASQTGTSMLDGVTVTNFEVSDDPGQLVGSSDVSSEESTTIAAAMQVLGQDGYTGTTADLSIDATGFIRHVRTVTHFSDGGTVTLDATLSDFGCAGTVLMPGQTGPSTPPAGCTSPDTGLPTTTTTGPAPSSTTTTTLCPPAASTTTTTTATAPTNAGASGPGSGPTSGTTATTECSSVAPTTTTTSSGSQTTISGSPTSVPYGSTTTSSSVPQPQGVNAMDDDALFLDSTQEDPPHTRPPRRRVGAVVAVVVALIAGAGVAAGLVVASGGPGPGNDRALAKQQVLSALSATTAVGSFDFTYNLSSTAAPGAAATTTTTQAPPPCDSTSGGFGGPSVPATPGPIPGGVESCYSTTTVQPETGPPVTGGGTIDTSPFAMVATASIGTDPTSGLQVTVRVDSSDVYEDLGNLDGGLAPTADQATATGQPISGFAGITDSTLGPLEGPVAMLDMASPTGYLDLTAASVTSANQTGTSTVDSIPVTDYRVTSDPSRLIGTPGISPEESQTITAAIALLNDHGYTGTTVDLSIDSSGHIRQVTTTASFADGATASTEATFTDFGCAGTVLMPGQTASGGGAPSCSSSTGPADVTTGTTGTTGPTVTTGTPPPPVTPTTVATTLPPAIPPASSVPATAPGSPGTDSTTTTAPPSG